MLTPIRNTNQYKYSPVLVFISMLVLLSVMTQATYGQENAADDIHSRARHGKNVLTLNSGIGTIGFLAASLSLQYERFITQDGSLSVDLSLTRYYGGIVSIGEFSPGDPARSKISGWYAAPGIRYHPFCDKRKGDVGLGAAIAIGAAHRRDRSYEGYSTYLRTTTDDHLFAALLIQPSVNFQTPGGFVFGFFLTTGYTIANTSPTVPEAEKKSPLYFQLGIKMGGRW